MALHTIECFSGVGMLGEGLRAGLAHLGIETRTICHIEREAYPASILAARGQDQCLDDAPVWSDITTFNARAFAGKVDCVVGGFPCQDLSLAGRRDGLDGKRSGLFFELVRIATDSGARYMLLENVLGIHSATATVMDEAEGELEERAAARVVGELADLGWNAEWVTLSASEVGASHGRARWFCWAWRMEVLGHPGYHARATGHGQPPHGTSAWAGQPGKGGSQLGNARLQHQQLQQRHDGAQPSGAEQHVEHTGCEQRRAGYEQDRSAGAEARGYREDNRDCYGSNSLGHTHSQCSQITGASQHKARGTQHQHTGRELDNPVSIGWDTRRDDHAGHVGHITHTASQHVVANPSSPRPQEPELTELRSARGGG
jgi:site-specific DNA-cytosine methylase